MGTTLLRYTDLPIGDRAAFELVCARHGFAPVHFDISACATPASPPTSDSSRCGAAVGRSRITTVTVNGCGSSRRI